MGAVGGGQHDLRGALVPYGGSTAYADQVLALAAPAITTSNLPVVLPITAPGWVQPRPDAGLARRPRRPHEPVRRHNQCVAGAIAIGALMHLSDPRWNHPPPLFGDAIDLFGVARAQGFRVSGLPGRGETVVYRPQSERPFASERTTLATGPRLVTCGRGGTGRRTWSKPSR